MAQVQSSAAAKQRRYVITVVLIQLVAQGKLVTWGRAWIFHAAAMEGQQLPSLGREPGADHDCQVEPVLRAEGSGLGIRVIRLTIVKKRWTEWV